MLRPSGSDEYLSVGLGRNNSTRVHRIVAEAFLGPPPFPAAEVCHGDGNRHNNCASNLRWDTRSNNHRDKVKHGTHNWGNRLTCELGHELRKPNLVPSALKKPTGGRSCLACSRTKANQRYAKKIGRPFNYEMEARWQYERIMNPGAATKHHTYLGAGSVGHQVPLAVQ